MNPRNLEHPGFCLLHIIRPHVNHIRREGERFHHAVPRLVAMGRFVAFQDHLPFLPHRIIQGLDIGRICRIVDVIGDAGAVIDAGQFPLQITLEHIVVVDALDHLRRQVSLLLREIDELLEVRQSPSDLPHLVHVAVELVHHKTRLADGVDVAVHRPGRDAQFRGQLVDGAAHVPGEQLHQAKEFGDFRGVHRLCFL